MHTVCVARAIVLCRALVCICLASLASCCDLHVGRSGAGLSSRTAVSGGCELSACVVLESLAHDDVSA
jgi:hypothetical protein